MYRHIFFGGPEFRIALQTVPASWCVSLDAPVGESESDEETLVETPPSISMLITKIVS